VSADSNGSGSGQQQRRQQQSLASGQAGGIAVRDARCCPCVRLAAGYA